MATVHTTLPQLSEQEIKRFWSKVQIQSPDQCWEWQSTILVSGGYGAISIRGKNLRANRIAYSLYYKEDPAEYSVCHKCDNPPCCNPHHLFKGTQNDNNQDALRKGRFPTGENSWPARNKHRIPRGDQHALHKHPELYAPRGSRNGMSKLNETAVLAIRADYANGLECKELSLKYGMSRPTISMITNRVTWKHI